MTAEAEGTTPRARSVYMILTASANDAGLTLDRDTAIRRAAAMGGMVAEMVVIADYRAAGEADPLGLTRP